MIEEIHLILIIKLDLTFSSNAHNLDILEYRFAKSKYDLMVIILYLPYSIRQLF